MDYEQKYKEALERARSLYKDALINANSARAEHCELIFPELKESEDERIRKEILSFCQDRKAKYFNDPKYINIDRWIAWLEKQGKETVSQSKEHLEYLQ